MGRLFVPFLQLQLIAIIIVQAAENENARVISIVEQFEDDTTWEFHSKSVRRAQVSRKTWDEYIKYKGKQHLKLKFSIVLKIPTYGIVLRKNVIFEER